MNEITAVFLMVWIICLLAHVANIVSCMKRWLPMKKGKTPQAPFIKKRNKIILWSSTIISYIAIIFFCVFFDVSLMEKAKLFAIIVIIVPVQPVGILLIVEYCFLFNQNRKFSNSAGNSTMCSNNGTGNG